jgi:hypothetical protein
LLALQGGNKLFGPTLKKIGDPLGDAGKSLADFVSGGSGGASAVSGAGGGAGITAEQLGTGVSFGSNIDTAGILSTGTSDGFTGADVSKLGFASNAGDGSAVTLSADAAKTLSVDSSGAESFDPQGFSDASAGSSGGSGLGYLDSFLKASNASKTNGDYRSAIGSAILNYFGAGAATPIVDRIAKPLSDDAMENGQNLNGVEGSFLAEPIGTLSSNRFEGSDILKGLSDPIDLFGGNPGGSFGGFLGQTLDPIGAASGSEDSFASLVSSLFGGW